MQNFVFLLVFSVVKIFVEGVHFPNNFMSLLLRISIVFVALVYLGQLRRKQHFIRTMWLSPNSLLSHPALRGSQMTATQTAQLIREFLASTAGHGSGVAVSSTGFKNEDELMAEYQDQPPNYEEALRCPVPNSPTTASLPGSIIPLRTISSSASLQSRAASQLTLCPPPSFDELSGSRLSLNSNNNAIEPTITQTTITVPDNVVSSESTVNPC